METPRVTAASGTSRLRRMRLGVILLGLGLLGHLLAARAIGGSAMAYGHHIFGFFLILLVTGTLIAGLGRLFWRGRHDITLVVVGVVQALFGLLVYVRRFDV
jgi:hypothetical protein